MRYFTMLTIGAVALSSMMATTLRADSPHFIKGPDVIPFSGHS
jgi:hypothetical protein